MTYTERLPLEEMRKLSLIELVVYIMSREAHYNTLTDRMSPTEIEEMQDCITVIQEHQEKQMFSAIKKAIEESKE